MGGILLIVSGLFAGYFWKSDVTPTNVSAENTNAESLNNFSAGTNSNVSNGNLSNVNTVLAEKKPTNKTLPETPTQPIVTTKNEAKETKKPMPNLLNVVKSNKKKGDGDNIVINEDKVEMGDTIIDENGIRDKKTGKILISDSTENPQSLSPETIRRLKKLGARMENKQNQTVVTRPPTPPTAPIPQATP